jgi:hypothetical protein
VPSIEHEQRVLKVVFFEVLCTAPVRSSMGSAGWQRSTETYWSSWATDCTLGIAIFNNNRCGSPCSACGKWLAQLSSLSLQLSRAPACGMPQAVANRLCWRYTANKHQELLFAPDGSARGHPHSCAPRAPGCTSHTRLHTRVQWRKCIHISTAGLTAQASTNIPSQQAGA